MRVTCVEMAPLPRIPRQLLDRINRAQTSFRSSSVRAFSTTTALGHASPLSKPSKAPLAANTASRSREAQTRLSQARQSSIPGPTIRITPTSKTARPAPSPASPSNLTTPRPIQQAPTAPRPTKEAIRAAEEREVTLRAGRLKRAKQRGADAIELHKEEVAKTEYQKRSQAIKRIWTISIMMMPVILVTSYYLFGRFVLGNEVKPLPEKTRKDDD
ncbi:hypothetical protein B0J13DRAFT_60768 [Dactylonectria estremocensis]|uniref:Uncharacterized protein n=1 Tax=Dactylonectria estremocensis TaxID=1079267 RepID=A0A9P9EKY6_9HYPO|nr:hypothetical protein B0J13DRAFT_60768 [Dactylonectria estremocensis]